MKTRAWLALLALAAVPGAAAAQDATARITAGGDGVVRMSFATREGVEICENGIRMFDHRISWHGSDWDHGPCVTGPATVELRVRNGGVTRVHTLRLGDRPDQHARDLGTVPAAEAVDILLAAARFGRSGRGAEDALFPAMLADAPGAWRKVMVLAEDRDAPRDARKSALFWLGQEAAEAASQGLARVAQDEDEEQEVRNAAVFALSQRDPSEGMPILMELARTARERETRRSAFFWLAQMDDPQVVAFFKEVLTGRGG